MNLKPAFRHIGELTKAITADQDHLFYSNERLIMLPHEGILRLSGNTPIETEYVTYTRKAGTGFAINRGAIGTSAQAHSEGTTIELVVTYDLIKPKTISLTDYLERSFL